MSLMLQTGSLCCDAVAKWPMFFDHKLIRRKSSVGLLEQNPAWKQLSYQIINYPLPGKHKGKGIMRLSARFIVCSAKGLLLGLFIASTALAQTKPKVAFVPQIVGIPYFNAMEEGGKDAAEKFGVEFIYSGPTDTNPAEQLRIVNGLIDQGVNAVSLSVLDASSIDPILNKARDKGIHIFTSDSDAPKSAREVYVAQALDQDLGLRSLTNSRSGLESKAKWELFPAKRLRRT